MKALIACLLAAVVMGCDSSKEAKGPQYSEKLEKNSIKVIRFAIHPLHNPQKLAADYQPVMDLLNSKQNAVRFELEASRDYASFEKKLRERKPEFALPNPWQTLEAIKVGYRVIDMAGEPEDFKGLIIVRKDSGINQIQQLANKEISYPSPTALAACIMPQLYLQDHGLNVMSQTKRIYVGSQESSIMNVYLKQTSAGATWPPPWRAFQREHPVEASQLKVAWQTNTLVNNSVMARDDMPPDLVSLVKNTLEGLSKTTAGQKILLQMETKRFIPADDADYSKVATYIQNFESKVRKVEDFN
jgi:phosphonate transport system substrate-binding protein